MFRCFSCKDPVWARGEEQLLSQLQAALTEVFAGPDRRLDSTPSLRSSRCERGGGGGERCGVLRGQAVDLGFSVHGMGKMGKCSLEKGFVEFFQVRQAWLFV